MDVQEAMLSLLSQIKSIDPYNAYRILGHILLQCRSDQDLLDYAASLHFPLLDAISAARIHFGLSSNTLPAPVSRPKNSQDSSPNSDSLSRYGDGNSDSGNSIGESVDCAQKDEEILDRHCRRAESDGYFRAADGKIRYGFRPCVFFATRGFCRNGDSCRLSHQRQQIDPMRMNAAQQQRLEGHSERMGESSVASMGDEVENSGQFQPERNESLAMVAMEERATRASKFIYFKFSPGSSFKDCDVSDYFSTLGPVQDVKFPCRKQRTFGFVEFVHSETVELVLSMPNPYLICGWPVFAKPYKEKGKVSDDSQRQQHLHQQVTEGGNYSPFSSPSGTEMLGQEPMVRKVLEQQAELQQAIEFQWKWLLNLQIPNSMGDLARILAAGSPSFLASHIPIVNQNQSTTSDFLSSKDNGDQSAAAIRSSGVFNVQNVQHETSSSETKAIDSHKGNHGSSVN